MNKIDIVNDIAKTIHKIAVCHGWWEKNNGICDVIALCHSELSEALEEARAGHRLDEVYYGPDGKPEGVPVEMIDCIIRILDFLAWAGVDIDDILTKKVDYNMGRPYKHGKMF